MDAADASLAFALCAELSGHGEDVRCVVAAGTLGVATASRDRTLRLYPYVAAAEGDAAAAAGARFGEPTVFVGHAHYVTALAWAPPGAVAGVASPQGALVSGSRDQAVFVWDVATATPLMRLTGHAQQVSAVALCAGGAIVSSDLGGEIRVWRAGVCVQTLPGPSPVLTLAALPDGGFVAGTGGPEFAIKRFAVDGSGGFALAAPALRGHADTVRRVAAVPDSASLAAAGGALLSASHDGSARLWSASGECLVEYLGHTALVYACAAQPGSGAHLVATGSEDDTARLWPAGGGMPVATLPHPGCVWDVTWLPGGQLVTACADGRARVWTPNAEHADAALAAAHAASLLARAAAAAAPAPGAARSDADLASMLPPGVKLEDPSVLSRPGAKDGATKVVREANGAAMAYSWDASAGRWEQIGEVVGADGAGGGGGGGSAGALGVGGRVLDGVSYDFVFDVDVADGAPPRKLPYNAGQNPYDAADKWLEREGLPASYREQIVAFIIQNTGGAASASLGAMPQNLDPFTGGGSYTPSAAPPPSATPLRRALAYCPVRSAVLFDSAAAGLEACGRKLREFSAAAPAAAALSSDEDTLLSVLLAAAAPGAPAAAGIDGASLSALFAKLLTWQEGHLFAVLDLARAAMLVPDAATALLIGTNGDANAAAGGDALTAALHRAAAGASLGGAGVVTALRCIANASASAAGRAWASAARPALLDAFAAAAGCPAKAARAAYGTALLNAAVEAASHQQRCHVIGAAVAAAAATPAEDDDAAFRALAALGTAAAADAAAKAVAREMGGADVAAAAAQRRGAPGAKAPAAAQDVLDIMGATA